MKGLKILNELAKLFTLLAVLGSTYLGNYEEATVSAIVLVAFTIESGNYKKED